MESNNTELFTVDQFAERMQVSRTTVFGWMKSGALAEGVHYIRLGRVLRFRWGVDLLFNSRLPPATEEQSPPSPPLPPRSGMDSQRGEAPVNSPVLTLGRGAAPAVNLDY